MSDFSAYMLRQAETRAAFEGYNAAGSALELARIRERLSEIKSQSEPLAGLLTKRMSERERLHAAAFYVVIGRFPEMEGGPK